MEADPRQAQALQQHVLALKQQQEQQEVVLKLSTMCWEKCVSNPSSKLSSRESACVSSCTERYFDTIELISKKMFSQQ